jgi:putative ABC transport system permease protein
MIHQFKIIFRNFFSKPVYSIITFTGFIFGIVASLLIYLWVYNEFSYEKFHPGYQRIYRVLTLSKQGDDIVKSAGCYRPVASTLKMTYPQIEKATYLSFSSEDSPLQKTSGGEKIESRCLTTNDDFFSIFGGFKFIEGSPDAALAKPTNIVLSEAVAKKLFGQEKALGKTVISDKYFKETYTVGGVVQIPKQSHIDFGFIVSEKNSHYAPFASSWNDKAYVHVYIKLAKNAEIDDAFLNRITNHLTRFASLPEKLLFQPLTDIHLYTDYQTYGYDQNISSFKYVWIFSGLAFLIMLMVALNFSVLSVARSSERTTEIGIKKVCGARRSDIIFQFMGEAVLQTIAASMIALMIIWLILPWFNAVTGQNLIFQLSFRLLSSLFLLTILVGILAGIYPSFYLSSLKPLRIFRGGSVTGSKIHFTRLLVVIQFSLTTFFILVTSIFIKQLNYIQGKDLGFNTKNIVVIPTGLWYDSKTFKDELLRNPDVLSVSATAYAPVDFGWQGRFALNHGGRMDTLRASMLWVDEDFAKTYKLQVIKGQFLQMDYNSYWKALAADTGKNTGHGHGLSLPVVINETAGKMTGFKDPVGQRIGDYVIVGIVKDFNFRPLRYPIGPLIMTNDPQNIMTMNVRISERNQAATLKYIGNTYQKHRDARSFSYSYFEDLLEKKYQEEIRLRNLTLIFSLLAIAISMLGILGMTVYSCDRRTKEIGIRKANGASGFEILMMLNRDFLSWVVLAFIIACPVAWFVLHRWLEGFAYRTALSWWIFILAGFLTLIIAMLAVNWQTIRVSRRNPVDALRNE